MAEIKMTLPTVQYGNVVLTGTPEEFGVELSAAGSIGEMAAVYVNLFTQGFRAGAERDVEYIPASGNNPEPDSVDMTAVATIQSELGATVVETVDPSDSELPWETEVKPQPKPWEKKAAPQAAAQPAQQAAKINW